MYLRYHQHSFKPSDMKQVFLSIFYTLLFVIPSLLKGQEIDSISTDSTFAFKRNKLVNLALWGKLSTNEEDTEYITNNLVLNFGWSKSQNINGLAIGLLVNEAVENINGIAIAGISNNAHATSNGITLGGLASIARRTNGIQIGSLLNSSENVNGIQIGGLFNTAECIHGIQIGLFFNFSSTNSPTQIYGIQIGGFNDGSTINGLQVGFSNAGCNINGIQIGMINMLSERVKGLQIGVVNIAEESDFPIGLVNIIKGGEQNVSLTYDEMQNLIASFRSGSQITYSIIGLGYHLQSPLYYMVVEAGIGVHIKNYGRFRLDTELVYDILFRGSRPELKRREQGDNKEESVQTKSFHKYSFRVLPSFALNRNIRIFGGVTVNYSNTRHEDNMHMFTSSHLWRKYEYGSFKQVNLGWMGGIQYVFH